VNPRHDNSFDALRLLGAVLVIVGHAYVLSARADQVPRFLGLDIHVMGVAIFFVISGYLIWRSWERTQSWRSYLPARILRIFPALAAVVVLTAFVLGPLLTSLSQAQYWSAPETYRYLTTALIIDPQYTLPGVFSHQPYSDAVNGSVWTLRAEFACYVAVPLIAYLWRPARAWVLAAAALGAMAIGLQGSVFVEGANLSAASFLWAFFFAGALVAHLKLERFLRPVPAFAVLALWWAVSAWMPTAGTALSLVTLTYVVLALGLAPIPVLRQASRWGDFSYGMYLVAFPVQQTLFVLLPGLGVWQYIAAVVLVSLPLAVASWWLIERPAMALRAPIVARLRARHQPSL
jgi:peptidoglycan/LPS O-acetylase OafA/YrhL